MVLKKSFTYSTFVGLFLLGCSSTKMNKEEIIASNPIQNATIDIGNNSNMGATKEEIDIQNHERISQITGQNAPIMAHTIDSLTLVDLGKEENEMVSQPITGEEISNTNTMDVKSPVAEKIVANYLASDNKEPGGHCLAVSKGRFEQAYKQVHGHLPYLDLPDSMATKLNTPKQVFNLLYDSASSPTPEWRNLPEKYRGRGNAGAIAYAGMGNLVDTAGIWSGELRPGALIQVWRYKEDYEQVVQGANVKKLDPYGHSFIFISYIRDEKNEIIGLKIADQGFQSYRPLIPRDYEVWWAVNLTI